MRGGLAHRCGWVAAAKPTAPADLCAHPINFIVGGPETVTRRLRELHEPALLDMANVEVRWAGLSHELVCDSLRRLMEDVMRQR